MNKNIIRSSIASKLVYNNRFRDHPRLANSFGLRQRRDIGRCSIWNVDEVSLLVAFRGTTTFEDIRVYCSDTRMTTFNIQEHVFQLHSGILKEFCKMENKLSDLLCNQSPKLKNITFTGHSIGGSYGQIASIYYSLLRPMLNTSCHVFGSPRVGDIQFTRLLETCVEDLVVVKNSCDVVPFLPMTTHPYNYVKATHEYSNTNWQPFTHSHDMKTYMKNVMMDDARIK